MATTNKEGINEITTACETASDILKSDEFKKGLRIILNKINTNDNNDYILGLFEEVINNENLNSVEESIINGVLENKEFKEYGKKILSRLPEASISATFKNSESIENFSKLFKKIKGYEGLELIVDTFIYSMKNKTDEIIEFKKIERLNDIDNKIKDILIENYNKKFDYEEESIWTHPMHKAVSNLLKYSRDSKRIIKTVENNFNILKLFYGDNDSYPHYEINDSTFYGLYNLFKDRHLTEDEVETAIKSNTILNKIDNINKFQVKLLIQSRGIALGKSELLKEYISLIKTEEDFKFFSYILGRFSENKEYFKKVSENYIYKRLPEYMIESWANNSGFKGSYYLEFLSIVGGNDHYDSIPENFENIYIARLIQVLGIKGYIDLYKNHKEDFKKYTDNNSIDSEKMYSEIDKLKKILDK